MFIQKHWTILDDLKIWYIASYIATLHEHDGYANDSNRPTKFYYLYIVIARMTCGKQKFFLHIIASFQINEVVNFKGKKAVCHNIPVEKNTMSYFFFLVQLVCHFSSLGSDCT